MDDWVLPESIQKTNYLLKDLKSYRKGEKEHFTEEQQKFLKDIDQSEEEGLDPKEQETHEEATRVKTISDIKIGRYKVDTWYYSPFPEGYHTLSTLFFCEFCLNFYVEE